MVDDLYWPWYPSEGSVKPGNFPDLVQSNFPLSTITPPMVVPCPPIHFVALWTDAKSHLYNYSSPDWTILPTISAPCSIGRIRYPPAPNVLSTISGMPALCATCQKLSPISAIINPASRQLHLGNFGDWCYVVLRVANAFYIEGL